MTAMQTAKGGFYWAQFLTDLAASRADLAVQAYTRDLLHPLQAMMLVQPTIVKSAAAVVLTFDESPFRAAVFVGPDRWSLLPEQCYPLVPPGHRSLSMSLALFFDAVLGARRDRMRAESLELHRLASRVPTPGEPPRVKPRVEKTQPVDCCICATQFAVSRSHALKNQQGGKGHYCSRECLMLARRMRRIGNPLDAVEQPRTNVGPDR